MASPIDLAIIFGYLALMLLIGFLVSRKEDLEGYFVNSRFWKRATAKAAMLSIIAGFLATLALIPVLKEQAFVPAVIISTAVFAAASYLTKHSATENIDLMRAD